MRVTARTRKHRATSRAAVLRQQREQRDRLIERIARLEAELAAERATKPDTVVIATFVPVAVPASYKPHTQQLTATSVPQFTAIAA